MISILYLEINLIKYVPLRGSTYLPLPSDIQNKKAVINIKNNDNKCFAYSILCHLHPNEVRTRATVYEKYLEELNFQNLVFPMQINNIQKFEQQNPNISVNVFGLSKKKDIHIIVGPLYHTQQRKINHINLLYLEDALTGKTHYCYINNLSRLVSKQKSLHHGKIHICDGCLVTFSEEEKIKRHLELNDCLKIRTELPNALNNVIEFKEFHKSFPMPFCIYSDFETILLPVYTATSDPAKKYTMDTHIHKPFSFAYFVKCEHDNSLSFLREYRGLDCVEVFVKWLFRDVRTIYKRYYLNPLPMKTLSLEQQDEFNKSRICYLCKETFRSEGNSKEEIAMNKVRDHDHFSGIILHPISIIWKIYKYHLF